MHRIMKIAVLFSFFLLPLTAMAQSWDYITTSEEYYYGVGHGADTLTATRMAMADMVSMISTTVSSEFTGLYSETSSQDAAEHKKQVSICVNTYAAATLRNTQRWIIGRSPDVTVRCYMRRSEMDKVYEARIKQAKDMILLADEALETASVGTALQHYYWAYSLIRSLQRPQDAVDERGRLLMNWLPEKIKNVLSEIQTEVVHAEGEDVDVVFNYKGKPVKNLDFMYSDGQGECKGKVNNGCATMVMAPGYMKQDYTLIVDYVCASKTANDPEMHSVLEVVGRRPLEGAEKKLEATVSKSNEKPAQPLAPVLKPAETQVVSDHASYETAMKQLLDAIRTRRYTSVSTLFTAEGKEVFDQLITYGRGRILGEPNLTFFKSSSGRVVVRGLQMGFTFRSGTKTTFTEDVVFTFNAAGKIENVAFGLGQVAEDDILCKYAPSWKDETRELIMEFMENYKTAYCLQRYDYIRDIFADDAVIIVGHVAKRKQLPTDVSGMSLRGQEVITENRYTKDQYLKNLKRCFDRNEFVNIHFTRNEVQYINKFQGKEFFAIRIGQEWNSSTYADKGFLFLLVDMTNHAEPLIKIRTWQPNEVDMDKLYGLGNFFDE